MSTEEISTAPKDLQNELPLTVYLKGDEPYFEDFSLRAEQVMDALQIKRSRLNQISGRELRVGKARIDHYLRAVYREEDVNRYQQWTRATVTHKRSSQVLNEASAKLEQQSRLLSEVWGRQTEKARFALEGFVKTHIESLRHALTTRIIKSAQKLHSTIEFHTSHNTRMLETLGLSLKRTAEGIEEIKKGQNDYQSLNLTLQRSTLEIESQRKAISAQESQIKNLTESVNQLSDKLANLSQELETSRRKNQKADRKARFWKNANSENRSTLRKSQAPHPKPFVEKDNLAFWENTSHGQTLCGHRPLRVEGCYPKKFPRLGTKGQKKGAEVKMEVSSH